MEEIKLKLIALKYYGEETGEFFKCSIEHYETLNKFNWNKNQGGYPCIAKYIKRKNLTVHQFIINIIEKTPTPNGYLIDHINSDILDNRRENLRFLKIGQNSNNKRKRENAKTTYIGVQFNCTATVNKYTAGFKINNKFNYIGTYSVENDAAIAYDIYVVQNNLVIEGRKLNYPENIEHYKTVEILKKPKKYRGVFKDRKHFVVKFKTQNGINQYRFKNEKECAEKYDEYVVLNGLDKKLNFPENYPNYIPTPIIKTFKEDIDEKTCKIKLNLGKETIISIESYDKIKYYKLRHSSLYVFVKVGNMVYSLHRYLTDEFDNNVIVDHKNSNPFNNTLENLRKTNLQGNGENKKKRKTKSSSEYLNIIKKGEKYITVLQNSSITYYKTHLTEEYAVRDRDLQIMKQAPNSLYKLYFKEDWDKPGEIEKWEDLLFFEEIDQIFLKGKGLK